MYARVLARRVSTLEINPRWSINYRTTRVQAIMVVLGIGVGLVFFVSAVSYSSLGYEKLFA